MRMASRFGECKALLQLLPLLSAICLGVGCSSRESLEPEQPRPIKTMVVAAGEEPRLRVLPGRVEASKKVDLAFQVPGLLLDVRGKEGDRVRKGDVIARLRQDEYQARLKTAQGQLDQARATLTALQAGERSEEQLRRESQLRAAEANLANTRTEFDRYARLVKSRAVSQSDYQRAETAYHIAQEEHEAARLIAEKGTVARTEDIEGQEAVVRGLEGRRAEANVQLRDSILRAPYDGVIAQILVDEGQNITAGVPVVKFQDARDIDIVVDVPEAFMASEIRPGAIQRMFAEVSSAPGWQIPVTIKEATQVADPATQTFQVRFGMRAPASITALPGMTATVTLAYQEPGIDGRRILVPISAISLTEAGEQVAWVLKPDQTVSRRPVKMGTPTDGQIEISEGLRPGDRIAVAGVSFLREGMKVTDLGDALGEDR
jgi:RND family efflux transporter MFP subunit